MNFFSKIFNSNKIYDCPIDEKMRLWIDHAFLWLMTQFGQSTILNSKMLIPELSEFQFEFKGNEDDAINVIKLVSAKMDINPDSIDLNFYKDHLLKIDNGPGQELTTQSDEVNSNAGLYFGKNDYGKYEIALEIDLLKDSGKLISTISHELAHIKILGENRLEINDECLTDLVTVFFGFGIFTANSSFKFHTDQTKWSYSAQGYLTQQEWGYALAIYSYIKGEVNPLWTKYLSPNIKSDYTKSANFIYTNEELILQ